MQPAETPRLLTGRDLRRWAIEGKIVPIAPTKELHGYIEAELAARLREFARPRQLGWVMVGEVGIYTRRDPDTVRGADIVYISRERHPELTPDRFLNVGPDLIVEILSPTDRWTEVMRKLEEYFGIGVRLVWISDPAAETIWAYRSPTDVRRFAGQDTLTGDEVLPGFAVPVAEVLRP